MNIDKRIAHFFEQVNFGERYVEICEKHSDTDKSLDTYELEVIKRFYEKKGLKIKFHKRERFFKNISNIGEFKVQLNINPYKGCIQFVFDFMLGDEDLDLGLGMWESITEELLNRRYTRKPNFCSVSELEEILEETFKLYENLREAILKN